MTKKNFCLLLAVIMALILTGCHREQNNAPEAEQDLVLSRLSIGLMVSDKYTEYLNKQEEFEQKIGERLSENGIICEEVTSEMVSVNSELLEKLEAGIYDLVIAPASLRTDTSIMAAMAVKQSYYLGEGSLIQAERSWESDLIIIKSSLTEELSGENGWQKASGLKWGLLTAGNRREYECFSAWLTEKYGHGGEEVSLLPYARLDALTADYVSESVDAMIMPSASWVKLLNEENGYALEAISTVYAESGRHYNPVILICSQLQEKKTGILRAFNAYGCEDKNILTKTYSITGFTRAE
ncbi:MAG: hypothetical protein IJS38_04940 [Erysipelotrichaceae bacterium]|nr:hypothetical protein [Erysipelotrichaceae bacterium]